jgi:hypothetical protein
MDTMSNTTDLKSVTPIHFKSHLQEYSPGSKMSRFTREQIADMTRGANVVRARKNKPDPIIRAVDTFRRRLAAYQIAKQAFEQKQSTLAPLDADAAPLLFVFPPEGGRPLIAIGTYFSSIEQIERAEKSRRKELRENIAAWRRSLKKPNEIVSQYEHRQGLEGSLKNLAELPKCVNAIKRRFRLHQAKVTGIQRRAHFKKFETAESNARYSMLRAYSAIANMEVTTPDGALALIECAAAVVQSKVIIHGPHLPGILTRARLFLAKSNR